MAPDQLYAELVCAFGGTGRVLPTISDPERHRSCLVWDHCLRYEVPVVVSNPTVTAATVMMASLSIVDPSKSVMINDAWKKGLPDAGVVDGVVVFLFYVT